MYELVQVSEKCYYINCPAKIGVYVADKDNVYLVDSGNDKDAGRKVRQILDKVEGMEAAMFVPAHADASADVKELVRYNRDKVHGVADRILSICGEPICFERILQEVFKGYGLAMNFEQYVLVGSTVRSYLSWLKDTGRLSAEFQDSMLLWQRVYFYDSETVRETYRRSTENLKSYMQHQWSLVGGMAGTFREME